jgi:hypothetical protein
MRTIVCFPAQEQRHREANKAEIYFQARIPNQYLNEILEHYRRKVRIGDRKAK